MARLSRYAISEIENVIINNYSLKSKTCKRHKACAKVFTEASNMANLNNLR